MEPPEDSGSAEPVFFSSVVPDSATWVASATCAGVVTVAASATPAGSSVTPVSPSATPAGPSSRPTAGMHRAGIAGV